MVADFFFALRGAVGTQFLDEQKCHRATCSRLLISNHVDCTHARPGFTDRQEIDRSIATVLVASSGLCASTAGPIPKTVFDIELGILILNEVPTGISGSIDHTNFVFMEGLSQPGADSALAGCDAPSDTNQ
jgi:hypothetical protein